MSRPNWCAWSSTSSAILPSSGTRVDLKSGFEVRRFQLRRVRYPMSAAVVGDEYVIFCVSHHERKAGYWAERLKKIER